MTNEQASEKAQELWGQEGYQPFALFDSRNWNNRYSVGFNGVTHGIGQSWEEAFAAAVPPSKASS